ncbi:hypothetical protein [Agromyces sp. SYSU T00194]|uniref:hypothetical protein n=1 Tax=Agromyces chitinivorans TaxID=3158560 RepID=UPI00339384FA
MGWTDGGGSDPKGLGEFNTDPTTKADKNKLRDMIAERGNRREGTNAERDALSGNDLYDGLEFYETDTEETWLYTDDWALVRKPRTAFTPTWTNLSPGSGASTFAEYSVHNGWVKGVVVVTLGTSPTVGDVQLAAPYGTVDESDLRYPIGQALFVDDSGGVAGRYMGMLHTLSSSIFRVARMNTGDVGAVAVLTSSTPFSWTSGDQLSITFEYPLA